MNGRHIRLVFQKEFTDLLRDRKTWIGALVIPIVVIPLVFLILGSAMSSVEKEARAYIPLAVAGPQEHPLVSQLRALPGVALLHPADPITALKQAEVRAVIQFPADFDQRVKSGQQARLTVFYDPSNQKSSYAREVIEQAVKEYETKLVDQRLRSAGLTREAIQPVAAEFSSIASDEKMTGSLLSTIIPLMLILSLISGGMPAATDLVAGEKERGTLESLISAPIGSSNVLTAKLLAVMIMSGVSAIASLVSLTLIFSAVPLGNANVTFSLGFFHADSLAVLIVMLLLLAAMFAGLELAISTAAKSFKEAQTYMSPIIFVGMVPAYMIMPLNPVDVPFLYYVLPIFNGIAIFKEIFYGDLVAWHALVAILSSLVYVSLAIGIASRLFRKESLIMR
ncbi:ABC transporter permease [Brevibacillus sp. B_LB10_24]|uniref:ABC transporter permease n=1 Tax=Brevibacillus sp. B_LB10_24 TaxID=3380645 RepID=UPI0038BC9591